MIESLAKNCADTSFNSIGYFSFQIRTIICVVSKFLRESVKFIKSTPIKLQVNHEILLDSIIWLCSNSAPVEEIQAIITPISHLAFIEKLQLLQLPGLLILLLLGVKNYPQILQF